MTRPGRAEAALHGAGVDERLLHVGQHAVGAERLDGHDVAVDGAGGQHQARAHERAVDGDRARAALALLARVLGAGQAEPLAQHVEQALAQPGVGDLVLDAVDEQLVDLAHAGNIRSRARWASTPTQWRR